MCETIQPLAMFYVRSCYFSEITVLLTNQARTCHIINFLAM